MAMNINLAAIAGLPCVSVSKRVFMQNHSYENVIFQQRVHFATNQTHFHALKGFT